MIKNYILIAIRNLWKRKLFSLINVVGLSVGIRLRYALVIFQFAISIMLISMILLISRQMNFMLNMDLGFNKDSLIVVEKAYSLGPRGEAF